MTNLQVVEQKYAAEHAETIARAEKKAADAACAQTILVQLGGQRFKVMTGASNFINDGGALSFALPGTPGFVSGGINHVRIELNAFDTYDLTFERVTRRGSEFKRRVVAACHGVYNDGLQSAFTSHTGLETHL